MHVINASNINDATYHGLRHLLANGTVEPSRNGKVIVAEGPVCTVYEKPLERVLFSPLRDANPFFHLMESLWMLAGRNDIAWPVKFNSKFVNYSDDGKSQFGAYGWRWRDFFGYDQLDKIIKELQANPASRRCVLAMWNAYELGEYEDADSTLLEHCDLYVATHGGKDVPCNTHAYFDCRGGVLNMTVCNRSNDVVWGAYGANAVHFSFLQEYIAAKVGVPVGVYRQFSNNFHAYLDIYDREKLNEIAENAAEADRYAAELQEGHKFVVPLISAGEEDFDEAVKCFIEGSHYDSAFLSSVAAPMLEAWELRKGGSVGRALEVLEDSMVECDWKTASMMWMRRRLKGGKDES